MVGSESMTGAIDMGDVVMMKKYYTNEEVKEGEIVELIRSWLNRGIRQKLVKEFSVTTTDN